MEVRISSTMRMDIVGAVLSTSLSTHFLGIMCFPMMKIRFTLRIATPIPTATFKTSASK